MRVTKLIKEHVTTTISKYYHPQFEAIGKVYNEERDELNAKITEIKERAEAEAQKLIETKYPGYTTGWRNQKIFEANRLGNEDKEKENIFLRNQLTERRGKEIDEILLELELGAGKAELAALLEKFQ